MCGGREIEGEEQTRADWEDEWHEGASRLHQAVSRVFILAGH